MFPSQSSCSPTISSSMLIPGKEAMKPAVLPQHTSEFQLFLCSPSVLDGTPLSYPNNCSLSNPIVIPNTTGDKNGIDKNVVIDTPPLPPLFLSDNSPNRYSSSYTIVIPDMTGNKNGIDNNVVINTLLPPSPFLSDHLPNRHALVEDALEFVIFAAL